MNIQNECHKYLESILGLTTDLSIEDITVILNELLVNKKIDIQNSLKEKKKYDLVKKYLDEINFIKADNFEIYRQNREKILFSNLKIDNKTRFSNPVINDNLTPTINAFYYCDKSMEILGDKEAAVLKGMNIDNKCEIIDKECFNGDYNINSNTNLMRNAPRNDFDQVSNLI